MSAEYPSGIRIGDRDRERVARILRAAVGEGLLTLEESDERQAAVYAAKYREELPPLTADLPDGGMPLIADELRAERWAASRGPLFRQAGFVAVAAAVAVTVWALSATHIFWPLLIVGFLMFRLYGRARWLRRGWSWRGYRPGYGYRPAYGYRHARYSRCGGRETLM
jgi:Domain of unknown function (DUF1707)